MNEELVMRYQETGNGNILETICKDNGGLVFSIVRDYRGACGSTVFEKEDLIQSGYIGLIRAVNAYDPGRGVPFAACAVLYIKAEILNDLYNTGRTIRIPKYRIQEFERLRAFRGKFFAEYGREPSRDDLSAFLCMNRQQVEKLLKDEIRLSIVSMDAPVKDTEDGGTVADMIPAKSNPIEDLEAEIQNEQLKRVLWGLVDALEPEQSEVLHRFYEGGEMLKDISVSMGLKSNQAKWIRDKALNTLKGGANRKILSEYAEDFIRAERSAYYGGLRSFMRSGTSATEKAVLQRIEAAEKAGRKIKQNARLADLSWSERKQYFEMLREEKRAADRARLEALKEEL